MPIKNNMNNPNKIENDLSPLLPVTSSDTDAIQDFFIYTWKEFFDVRTKEEAFLKRKDLQNPVEFYKNHNGNFWCLRKDNKIIATIAVHEILFQGEKVGFLRRFFIDKNYRNKGLGSKMLKFIENYSYEKKWKYLMFGVDISMERNKWFYNRNGYEEFIENIPQELIDDNDTWYLRKRIYE